MISFIGSCKMPFFLLLFFLVVTMFPFICLWLCVICIVIEKRQIFIFSLFYVTTRPPIFKQRNSHHVFKGNFPSNSIGSLILNRIDSIFFRSLTHLQRDKKIVNMYSFLFTQHICYGNHFELAICLKYMYQKRMATFL